MAMHAVTLLGCTTYRFLLSVGDCSLGGSEEKVVILHSNTVYQPTL